MFQTVAKCIFEGALQFRPQDNMFAGAQPMALLWLVAALTTHFWNLFSGGTGDTGFRPTAICLLGGVCVSVCVASPKSGKKMHDLELRWGKYKTDPDTLRETNRKLIKQWAEHA